MVLVSVSSHSRRGLVAFLSLFDKCKAFMAKGNSKCPTVNTNIFAIHPQYVNFERETQTFRS